MTDLERDAIECEYPTYSDIVRIAKQFSPMSGELHTFIEKLCALCGWPEKETFDRIFSVKK